MAARKMTKIRVPYLRFAYKEPDANGFQKQIMGRLASIEYKSPTAKGEFDPEELAVSTQIVRDEKRVHFKRAPPEDDHCSEFEREQQQNDLAKARAIILIKKYNKLAPSARAKALKKFVERAGWKLMP